MIELTKDQIRMAFGECLQLNLWPYEPAKRPVVVDENFVQALYAKISLLLQQAERNAAANAERERTKGS
jgi:hypothetical protein